MSQRFLEDSLHIHMKNFQLLSPLPGITSEDMKKMYFASKPIYVMDYFAILVDQNRHIRGYYDPNFNVEVKRMIQEYKHLKLRDEHAKMEEKDKLEQKGN